jgi:hypothetical protein
LVWFDLVAYSCTVDFNLISSHTINTIN